MNHALPRPPASEAFQGKTYSAPRDYVRLTGQLEAVFNLMKDGGWRTHAEIGAHVDGSTTGISARLRDLRKPQYGGHRLDKRPISGGTWEYRLILNKGVQS